MLLLWTGSEQWDADGQATLNFQYTWSIKADYLKDLMLAFHS